MLKFLGRGSAFTDNHNCAFFKFKNDLVFIDFPMTAFLKLKNIGLNNLVGDVNKIYVLVTHTHCDHIGGIPMLIHYAYHVWKVPVIIAVPSEEIEENLRYYIGVIEGCYDEVYTLIYARNLPFVKNVIKTSHSWSLDGRCFGYCLNIEDKNVVYTGDTNTLAPYLPYLDKGTILYTEISNYKAPMHLCIEDVLYKLKQFTNMGISVYLMHIDDEDAIKEEIAGTNIQIAELYN